MKMLGRTENVRLLLERERSNKIRERDVLPISASDMVSLAAFSVLFIRIVSGSLVCQVCFLVFSKAKIKRFCCFF